MSDVQSPSPVIDYFVTKIEASLRAEDKARLATYANQVTTTTHHGDFRRAWHCVEWALRLAERPSSSHLSHLVKDLKEVHSLWKDTVFGADFGVMVKDGVGPGQDVEIQWVDDTVAVAAAEAERSGWAAVPWEELLQQMLAVAPAQE